MHNMLTLKRFVVKASKTIWQVGKSWVGIFLNNRILSPNLGIFTALIPSLASVDRIDIPWTGFDLMISRIEQQICVPGGRQPGNCQKPKKAHIGLTSSFFSQMHNYFLGNHSAMSCRWQILAFCTQNSIWQQVRQVLWSPAQMQWSWTKVPELGEGAHS